jgi:uncharacterized protein YraI
MKVLRAFVLSWIVVLLAGAQTAVVKRNVNLRSDPSTSHDPIKKLTPGTQINILDSSPTNGFLHVQAGADSGWVWSKNVQIQATPAAGPSSGGPPEGPITTAISSSWDKPDPQDTVFHGDEGDCGETGDGGDTDTNRRKNRVDISDQFHPVAWSAINSLAFPQGAPRSRMDWTQSQLDQISPVEGVALSVEGFLYKVKVESSSANATSGGESTNCHAHLANDVDWHMPLTANDGEAQSVAIIVETTPRLRQKHPNWTTARLKPWTAHNGNQTNAAYNHQKVRISGWLMLDPEHQDMIDEGLRSTLWEIHPITKIEVWDGSQWVDLDNQ